jgi:ribose transport system substrate-binding protein
MLKMLVATGAAMLLATGLLACGDDDSDSVAASDGAGQDLKFAYVSGAASPAYNTVGCGARDAGKELGVEVTQQDPTEFSPSAQTRTLNGVIASKPDGIIISPNDASAMLAPILQADAQGIPVTTALNTLSDSSPLKSVVVNDEEAGGKAAADFLGNAADGQEVKVAAVTFKPEASLPADTRWHAFEEQIKTYPNIDYLGAEFVQDVQPSAATPVMNAILARHPDLWGVHVTFGQAGDGAVAAIRQRRGNVKVVTYDPGNPATLKELRDGEVDAVVGYRQRKLGAEALRQAYNAATGKPVKKDVKFPPIVYTKDKATPDVIAENESPDC